MAPINLQRPGVQVNNIAPLAHRAVACKAELEIVLDSPGGRGNVPEDGGCLAVIVYVARHGWWYEVDLLAKTLDIFRSQEAEDCHACKLGVAVPVAVLGYDEGAFVVDADEVAGAGFDLVVVVAVFVVLRFRAVTYFALILESHRKVLESDLTTNKCMLTMKQLGFELLWDLWKAPPARHSRAILPLTSLNELVLAAESAREVTEGKSRLQHLLDDTGLCESAPHNPMEMAISLVDFQRAGVQVNNIRPLAEEPVAGEFKLADVLDWAGGSSNVLEVDGHVLVIFVMIRRRLEEADMLEQTPDVASDEQPAEDHQATTFGVAIVTFDLGVDEAAVVVDAGDGAGPHVPC